MDQLDTTIAADTERTWTPYVPPLQRTAGQPPPIAANGGLSYMSFDRTAMREPPRRSGRA